jgi:hypothetical protein
MPMISVPDDPGLRAPLGQTPVTPEPVTDRLLGAAFRQSNVVVSAIQAMRNSGPFTPEDNYTALPDIKDTSYFDKHATRFAASASRAETDSIKRQIDQEEADRKVLEASGGLGMIAGMVAGTLDPTMLLPGRVAVGAVKEGGAFLRGALEVGGAMAAQSTAQEIGLHASQQTRTAGESAINVASATLLGALLGGTAVSMLARGGRYEATLAALDRDRAEMAAHATGEPTKPPTNITENIPGAPPIAPDTLPPSAGVGMESTVGAAATDTRTLQPVSAFGLEKLPTDPMSRLVNSPSLAARRSAVDLAEPTGRFVENLEGIPTTAGPSLDRLARLAINQTKVAVGDTLDRLWKDLRFAGEDAPWFARARDAIGSLDRPPELPNFDQFKAQVSEALRNGDQHAIPQVQEAAQFIRKTLFDPWKERAIKAGLLPEDIAPKTADSYLQRVYNKQAIAAQRPEFVNTVLSWLQGDQATKAAAKDRLSGYSRQLEMAEKRIAALEAQAEKLPEGVKARADIEYDIRRAGEVRDQIRANVEAEIHAWEGHSSRPAKAALRARAKAEEGRAPDLPRLRAADPEVDAAVRRIIESDRELTAAELRDRAHQITERVLGSPDGRLPYDEAMGGPQAGFRAGGEAPRGPLAAREFNIPDAQIAKWLENDIEHIVNAHLRTMVPDVLLAERFGDVAMTEAFRKIEDDFARLIDATKSETQRTKLGKQRETAIRDLAAIRDRIRGVYGMDTFNAMRGAARVAQAVKNYNVLASMGMATVSSLPDMAGAVFRHGLGNVFSDAWAPFARFIMGGGDEWKQAGKQYRAMGIATESVIAQRHHALSDIMDNYRPASRLERTLQVGADKFQFANLLAPWTDFGKINASMVAGAEILRAAEAITNGTATKKQIASLAESGIDSHLASRIWGEFARDGAGEVVNGVHLPNTDRWQSRASRDAFEGAVGREADIAIVTPGQEKPLWLSNPIISVISQFKSFMAAATQRILIANLQRSDAQVLQGLIFSMGLGMVSYKLNSMLGGQPTSDKPQDWIKEAISRGSLLGWFEEGNALASKMTRGGVDMYRLIGADKPLSRYAGRSVLDQMLGPTAGKVEALAQVTGAAASRDWKESDTKAVHKLTVFGNLFYLRGLFNQVERGANNAFGVPMKEPTQH